MRAVNSAHGADVDDIALPLLLHLCNRLLRQKNLSVQVGADRRLQLLTGGVREGDHVGAVNRVIDQNVQPAVFGDNITHKRFDRRVIAQIQRHAAGIIAVFAQCCRVFLALGAVAGSDNHCCTGFAKSFGNGGTIEPSSACNDRYAAVQSQKFHYVHKYSPFSHG